MKYPNKEKFANVFTTTSKNKKTVKAVFLFLFLMFS